MIETIDVKETVLKLKMLDTGLMAVIDKRSTLRLIAPEKMHIVDGFKTKLLQPHVLPNIVDISKDGTYTLIGLPENEKAALFLTNEKKLFAKLGPHKGYVEAVAISDDNHYVATGGTDGRTYIYHTKTASMLMALMPHADYVTAIAFNAKSTLVATGSFDRSIHVKNIALMTPEIVLHGHNSVIKKLYFLSSDRLLSMEKAGHLVIWDLNEQKIKYRLPKLNNDVLDFTLTADHKFLFVSTVVGSIALYNLESLELINHKYVQGFGPITALAVVHASHRLMYANKEGEINQHYLLEGEEALKDCLLKGQFGFAYSLVGSNALLGFSEHYLKLEAIWHETYERAKTLLMQNKKEEALVCFEPFAKVAKKSSIIQKTLKDYVEFGKFVHYIEQEKYALAYSIVAKYPIYKETKEYEALEALWEKKFAQAKRAILESSGEETARESLALFRGISEKAQLISELFNHRKVYLFFRKKLAQKDFFSIFNLIKQYPFIKELKEYKDIMKWADHVYIKINHHYQNHEFLDAIKLAESIKDFPPFKEEIATLLEHSEIYMRFDQAMKNSDKNEIYKLLDKYPFLGDVPMTSSLDPEWDKAVEASEAVIAKGDVATLLKLFEPYFKVSYKKAYLTTILKSAYIRQIERAIKNGVDSAIIANGVKTLYVMFGEDEMINQLVERCKNKTGLKVKLDHLIPSALELVSAAQFPENILNT